jgi:predicted CopG family antitoxin
MMDMPDKIPQTIRISERTARRLIKMGKFGETFDDVIARLLDELDEFERRKKE